MDLDVNEGSFSSYFPLPYRIAVIIDLGLYAWASSLHVLHLVGIDTNAVFHPVYRTLPPLDTDTNHHKHLIFHYSPTELYSAVYEIATVFTGWTLLSLFTFWTFTSGDAVAVIKWHILPLSCFVIIAVLALCPFNVFHKQFRFQFLRILARVSHGGLSKDGKFGDIILADILTSYAKVLGDLFVMGCMFTGGFQSMSKPDRACGGKYMVPFVISIPYLIRLRQCFTEFARSNYRNNAHIMNGLKYASAFPVIFLSAMQRSYISPIEDRFPDKVWFGESMVFRCWILSVLINSLFSFYWDVVMDWQLQLLPNLDRSSRSNPWNLRRYLYFKIPAIYYTVIILNLFLRMTWSLKLSSQLHHLNDLEGGIFVLETLEVIRRWIWIFFRCEAEWSKIELQVMTSQKELRVLR